jgi:hypothetical protein
MDRQIFNHCGRLGQVVLIAAFAVSAQAAATAAEPPVPAVFEHPQTAEQLSTLLGPAAGAVKAAAALRGDFTQRKFLRELPQPLVSSGEYFVARGLGVYWHTQKPFDGTVVLTPQAMIQRGSDGSSRRIASDQQPGLRAVGQVFDALFTLDLAQLAETFTLFGVPGEKGTWTLGLVPREPAFAKVMNRVQITGTSQPGRIVLFEGSGDRTEIDFGAVKAQQALSEADNQYFAP